MKTINRLMCSVPIMLLAALLSGCPGSGSSNQPTITLTVTDCAGDNITMTATGSKTQGTGNRWQVTATIDVKCSGAPVPNAELKAEFWWPGGTLKLTTGPDGKATYRRTVDADPTGNAYTVTIKANDGEKPASYTF